jgi:hypothetical protein
MSFLTSMRVTEGRHSLTALTDVQAATRASGSSADSLRAKMLRDEQGVSGRSLAGIFGAPGYVQPSIRPGLFQTCSNPACSSGWLHLLRSRSTPIFESGWCCSALCTTARLSSAITREMNGRGTTREEHRHRIPLGLLMLEKGWITSEQLRHALESQRTAGGGRLGSWLMRLYGVSEHLVTRALGLQWNSPVLSLDAFDPETLTSALPRLFVDAFGALPIRLAGGRILYLGFEERIDPVLALSIGRMTGLHVECGVVQSSCFHSAHRQMLNGKFPAVQLIEAASEQSMARALGRVIERARPIESRIVRVHDCLWLRIWKRSQTNALPTLDTVEDILCSIRN